MQLANLYLIKLYSYSDTLFNLTRHVTVQGLEYRWVQTGKLVADGPITALSWNLEGTRLLTGGKILQLWHQASLYQDDSQREILFLFSLSIRDALYSRFKWYYQCSRTTLVLISDLNYEVVIWDDLEHLHTRLGSG